MAATHQATPNLGKILGVLLIALEYLTERSTALGRGSYEMTLLSSGLLSTNWLKQGQHKAVNFTLNGNFSPKHTSYRAVSATIS